jgi:hypothetical protein
MGTSLLLRALCVLCGRETAFSQTAEGSQRATTERTSPRQRSKEIPSVHTLLDTPGASGRDDEGSRSLYCQRRRVR